MPFKSELTAPQPITDDLTDLQRRALADGIEVIEGSTEDGAKVIKAVVADGDRLSKEDFVEYLQKNGFEAKIEDSEAVEGEGIEQEDGGKKYRLDDGSDRVEYSKPVTMGTDLTFFSLGDDSDARDLHVLKVGPLHDLDSGELVLDLDEDRLREIADTTQAIINVGHALPVSFEHGIEAGFRGIPSADRRPYGEITSVYFDEDKKAIYARKRWTEIGRKMVESSLIDNAVSALRVSPRVKLTPAHHPDTGEILGTGGYIDVVSLTTLPRQASMENVALSRVTPATANETINADDDTPTSCGDGIVHGNKGCDMAGQKKAEVEQVIETLLGRGTSDATRLIEACGLDENATGEELSRRVADIREELDRAQIELGRYREVEANRVRAEREAEADTLLDSCELSGAERDFYRASLLGDSDTGREFARKAIEEKGKPDQLVKVTEAIETAKARGALAADFGLTEELVELARESADTVVALFGAMPAGQVVRVGEPAGVDAAGVGEPSPRVSPERAERELSRIARKFKSEGKAKNSVEAWELARTERADLVAAMNGE